VKAMSGMRGLSLPVALAALALVAQVTAAAPVIVEPPPRQAKFWWGTDTRNGAGVVMMEQKVLFEIRRPAGGYNTSERAEIVAGRLARMYAYLRTHDIRAGKMNNEIVVLAYAPRTRHGRLVRDPQLIVTVDQLTATDLRRTRWLLAHWWRDLFRDYMLIDTGNAPVHAAPAEPLLRDYARAKREHQGDEAEAAGAMGEEATTRLRALYEAPPATYEPAAPDIPK
jgi:hypothetical protein